MITLHQYPAVWGLSSLSPFCIKVEAFLRMAKLPYEVRVELNPAKGPKGKMPFIQTPTQKIADSSFIIDHLLRAHELHDLKPHTPKERALAQMLQSMIEEHLYFCLLHSRWAEDENYRALKLDFKKLFPAYLGGLSLFLIRHQLLKQSQAQGIGRHSMDEVHMVSEKLIATLSDFISDQPYALGKRTYVDATAYAFLVTILKQPFESELKKAVLKHENLVHYTRRLDQELDFDSLQN